MMGNRGGALHDDGQRLCRRRWVSRQWICCLVDFRRRRREVMAPGRYTELFFLDEATALAAGHRPCFECRRADAARFGELWSRARGASDPLRAADIDKVLHDERLEADGTKRLHAVALSDVPDGAMVLLGISGRPHLVRGGHLFPWSFAGYGRPVARQTGGKALALTPPGIIEVLKLGYSPITHESARVRV